MENKIILTEKFGTVTGIRHCDISDKSGEEFYHEILNEEFKNSLEHNSVLTVDLDGGRGYSPSFIDESFGNLVFDFTLKKVEKFLNIKSNDVSFWKEYVKEKTYILWEEKRIKNGAPIKTRNHRAWWRLVKGEFKSEIWIQPTKSSK